MTAVCLKGLRQLVLHVLNFFFAVLLPLWISVSFLVRDKLHEEFLNSKDTLPLKSKKYQRQQVLEYIFLTGKFVMGSCKGLLF